MQFVFCAASHITKKAGSLTLAVEQKEYNSFFCSLRVPAKWMHLNGEVAHSRAGGKGSETEKYCAAEGKKKSVFVPDSPFEITIEWLDPYFLSYPLKYLN